MTCIIGLVHEGKVYIGGDSQVSNGWGRDITARKKVFRVGDFLIGCCGSIRMQQLLQYSLAVREQESGESPEHYMVTAFIEAARETFKKGGYLSAHEQREEGGEFLVGYGYSLFRVESDFQVDVYANGLAACGVGAAYALGAMHAFRQQTKRDDYPGVFDPETVILDALTISGELCNGVSAPFYVEAV